MQGSATAPQCSGIDWLTSLTRTRLQDLIRTGPLHAPAFDYLKRLEYEIKVFAGSGYADVILIIADYIGWARENEVVVGPGRGSAAGSLVVYLAGITTIDPLQFGLIFERFLNPERVSLPDIDTDFSDRDAVIDYLRETYGQNRVAKVGVPSLFKPRSAIDEFAKAFELDFPTTKRITKLIGDAKTFDEAFGNEPALADLEREHSEVFRLARLSQGFVRQISTHPSAVILARGPIGAEIPMQKPPGSAKEGILATGWDGEELDSLGYVKLDILTIDNLAIIDRTIRAVKERHGVEIDFYNLPLDDRHALDGFVAGETVAVFQLEEPKSVGILKRMPGITFEEVCAVNALIRPGLDVSGFLDARNGGDPGYLVEALEPILRSTYGVILYQEQVMQMCVQLAGFSMAGADKFRKIIAKTANQAVDFSSEDKEKFRAGYVAQGHPPDTFDDLWAMIVACQTYVFNKSHAVSYGYIAYADMYLKRYYPLEFMCAALQTRSRELYIKECERLGIAVLPPDVNKSEENYSIEDDSIRMGLSCIKHVGKKARIIISRRPYQDEFDFLDRAKPNNKQIEALTYGGALDCFDERKVVAQTFLKQSFHDEVTIGELATGELNMLGFYLVFNPLGAHKDALRHCVTPMSARQPTDALVGGMVSRVHEHTCKNNKVMAFVTLLTTDGEMDTLVWPDDWASQKRKMKSGAVIVANGKKTDKGNYAIRDCEVLS